MIRAHSFLFTDSISSQNFVDKFFMKFVDWEQCLTFVKSSKCPFSVSGIFLSRHADRQGVDILFTGFSVCG